MRTNIANWTFVAAVIAGLSLLVFGCLPPTSGDEDDPDARNITGGSGTMDGGTGGTGDGGGTSGTTEDGGTGTSGDASATLGDGGDGSGTTGDGGTGGSTWTYCARECGSASDCTSEGGNSDNWKCTDGACDPEMCQDDPDCTPVLGGWTDEDCSQGSCPPGRTCVQHDGSTFCAYESYGSGMCEVGDPIQKQKADGSGQVTVCGKTGTCHDGLCAASGSGAGCESNSDCPNGGTCDAEGRCVCQMGDCSSGYKCSSP